MGKGVRSVPGTPRLFFFFFLPAYLASDLGVLREALQACQTPGCIFYSAELVFGTP